MTDPAKPNCRHRVTGTKYFAIRATPTVESVMRICKILGFPAPLDLTAEKIAADYDGYSFKGVDFDFGNWVLNCESSIHIYTDASFHEEFEEIGSGSGPSWKEREEIERLKQDVTDTKDIADLLRGNLDDLQGAIIRRETPERLKAETRLKEAILWLGEDRRQMRTELTSLA